MKILYLSIFLFLCAPALSQNKGDSKIVITLSDTTDMREKIRLAFAKADFIIKDLNDPDSITTYPRELKSISGTSVARAIIKGDKITLSGFYSLKKLNYFGFAKSGKDVKPIIYYKSGKLWPLLMKVANNIGGTIGYAE